jgi:hypothetical protein
MTMKISVRIYIVLWIVDNVAVAIEVLRTEED